MLLLAKSSLMPLNPDKEQAPQPVDVDDPTAFISEQNSSAHLTERGSTDQSWINAPTGIINGMFFGMCFWLMMLAIAFLFF